MKQGLCAGGQHSFYMTSSYYSCLLNTWENVFEAVLHVIPYWTCHSNFSQNISRIRCSRKTTVYRTWKLNTETEVRISLHKLHFLVVWDIETEPLKCMKSSLLIISQFIVSSVGTNTCLLWYHFEESSWHLISLKKCMCSLFILVLF